MKIFTKNNSVKFIKTSSALLSGLFDFSSEFAKDGYYSIQGNKKINKLVSQLGLKNKKFNLKKIHLKNKYPYIDASVIGGLTAMEMARKGIPTDVENAYMFAFPIKQEEVSFLEAWDEMSSYEERLGFISAVKGKLFEIKYTDYLNNNLEEGYIASMASSANQTGWDIKVEGPDKEIAQLLQLKATDSASYVNDAIAKYPEIDIVSISDLQGQMTLIAPSANITLTEISNSDLLTEIITETERSSLFFPSIPLLSLGFIVFDSYRKKDISEYQKNHNIGKRSGNLFVNSTILISSTPFIGIPLIIGKELIFANAKKKRILIQYLKNQIKQQKKSEKVWDKQVSRRSFIQGLTAVSLVSMKPKKIF